MNKHENVRTGNKLEIIKFKVFILQVKKMELTKEKGLSESNTSH